MQTGRTYSFRRCCAGRNIQRRISVVSRERRPSNVCKQSRPESDHKNQQVKLVYPRIQRHMTNTERKLKLETLTSTRPTRRSTTSWRTRTVVICTCCACRRLGTMNPSAFQSSNYEVPVLKSSRQPDQFRKRQARRRTLFITSIMEVSLSCHSQALL